MPTRRRSQKANSSSVRGSFPESVPSALNPEIQTCSVARSGVFDATSLHVAEGSTLADFEERLRELGMYLEKLPLVPPGSGGSDVETAGNPS